MWDAGQGQCVVCGEEDDRDILGRCYQCFCLGIPVQYGHFKEVGRENPGDPKGSTAHVRDIKNRRMDPQTKQPFYYKGDTTYFIPKGS